jgi:hypothetical protein
VFALKTKGKYFLDVIDDVVYSIDSYSVFYWYNRLFYDFDVHIDTFKYNPKEELDPTIPITDNTLKEALNREKSYYENGYIYKSKWFKIRGKQFKKGRWEKDPEKAKLIFEKIKTKYKELFLKNDII